MTVNRLGEVAKLLVYLATVGVLAADTFVAPNSAVGHVLFVVGAVLGAVGVYKVKNADPPPVQ